MATNKQPERILSVRQVSDDVVRYTTLHGKFYRAILDLYPRGTRFSRKRFARHRDAQAYRVRFLECIEKRRTRQVAA